MAQVEVDFGPYSGTQAPISLLFKALNADTESIAEVRKTKRDFCLAQEVTFAALQSHIEGGRCVRLEGIPEDMVFWAKTGEFYA